MMMKEKKRVPKLRFLGFEGEWEKKAVEDVLTIGSGKDYKHLKEGDIPVYGTGGLMTKVNDYLYDGESIGIGRKGTIDKPVYLSGKFWTVDTLFYTHSFRDSISKFIFFQFQRINWKLYNEASGVPSLSKKTIEKININIPKIEEQQKIATFLTSIDTRIQQLEKKKTLLEEYKKGVMQKIFKQEIRFKDEEGKEFVKWERRRFSNYIKLYRGSSPRPINRFQTKDKDGVNWIKIGDTKDVQNYILKNVSEKITKSGATKSRAVKKGELILANSMSFGKTYLLDIDGCIYDGWFVLREYEKSFDKSFLLHQLNSEFLQRQYKRLSTGGVVQNISSDIVYSTILTKPDLEEQTKIANFLTALDTKITVTTQQVEETKKWKKGLLQQMFI